MTRPRTTEDFVLKAARRLEKRAVQITSRAIVNEIMDEQMTAWAPTFRQASFALRRHGYEPVGRRYDPITMNMMSVFARRSRA